MGGCPVQLVLVAILHHHHPQLCDKPPDFAKYPLGSKITLVENRWSGQSFCPSSVHVLDVFAGLQGCVGRSGGKCGFSCGVPSVQFVLRLPAGGGSEIMSCMDKTGSQGDQKSPRRHFAKPGRINRRYWNREDGKEEHFRLNSMGWPSWICFPEVHGGPALCRASPRAQVDEDRPFLRADRLEHTEKGLHPIWRLQRDQERLPKAGETGAKS